MSSTITRGKVIRADLANFDGRTFSVQRLDATGGTVSGVPVGNEVDVLQVYGSANNRNVSAITNAVQMIGESVTATLVFAPGSWVIDSNVTIPSNFACRIPGGCSFVVAFGRTLTFEGPVYADSSDFHTGTGDVALSADSIVNGQVWYKRTDAEILNSVIPEDYSFLAGNIRRYGADPTFTSDSTDAIQTAIDLSAPPEEFPDISYPAAYVPAGRYKVTDSLVTRYEMAIEGESEYVSVIQASVDTFPLFINDSSDPADSCTRTRVCNLTLRGGTYAFDYDLTGAEVQSLGYWRNIRFDRQVTRAIRCSQFFLVNTFDQCVFFYCQGAFECGLQTNLNNWIGCRFEGMSADTFILNSDGVSLGGEMNWWSGCRFEARGTPASDAGDVVFYFEDCVNSLIENSYFEDTWKTILEESGADFTDTTTFRNNRFTGQELDVGGAGLKTEEFISDGIVNMEHNFFQTGSDSGSTAKYLPVGRNRGLNTNASIVYTKLTDHDGAACTAPFSPASGAATSVFRFNRSDTTNLATNAVIIGGTVTVAVTGADSGNNPFAITKVFPFAATGYANATMDLDFGSELTGENNGPAAAVVCGKANADADSVEATITVTEAAYVALRVRAWIDWKIAFDESTTAIPTVTVLQ